MDWWNDVHNIVKGYGSRAAALRASRKRRHPAASEILSADIQCDITHSRYGLSRPHHHRHDTLHVDRSERSCTRLVIQSIKLPQHVHNLIRNCGKVSYIFWRAKPRGGSARSRLIPLWSSIAPGSVRAYSRNATAAAFDRTAGPWNFIRPVYLCKISSLPLDGAPIKSKRYAARSHRRGMKLQLHKPEVTVISNIASFLSSVAGA